MKKSKQFTMDIVVLTAGRVDLFEKCIDHILPQLTPQRNLVIMNNGANTPEYAKVYSKIPDAYIKRSNANLGFAAGANMGIKGGDAPLVMFVTDDVFLNPDAIDVLERRMADQSIGICGMKLLFPEGGDDSARPSGKVQHIGMASNIRGEMIHPLIGWSPENPKCCISQEVLAVTGAAFMIRRDVYRIVGGFDTVYGKGYYEDMDLCFACRAKAGKRVFIDTDSVGVHGVAQTFKVSKEPAPNFQQNMNIFRSRWVSQTPWSEFNLW